MKCLNQDQIALAALGLADHDSLSHAEGCPVCSGELDSLRQVADGAAAAHAIFDRGHDAARGRLLAVLAALPPPSIAAHTSVARTAPRRHSWGNLPNRWAGPRTRWLLSATGVAAACLLAVTWLLATRPVSAMARAVAAVRQARSLSFELLEGAEHGERSRRACYVWAASGSLRVDQFEDGWCATTEINPAGKPGIFTDHAMKSYYLRPARLGQLPPLQVLSQLSDFAIRGEQDLGTSQVDNRPAHGFRIAQDRVVAGAGPESIDVWLDSSTDLPLLIEMSGAEGDKTLRMRHFGWNAPLDTKIFDTTPPAGYVDRTPSRPTLEEQTAAIIQGFRTYAELNGGRYPQVTMIYGDVTLNDMLAKIGASGPVDVREMDDAQRERYRRVMHAARGFTNVNGILRDTADAAYHGRSVGPADGGKALLYWRLDDGSYSVIFGDLKSEVVSADRLRRLRP